jgi:hypothetical protein
MQQDNWEKQRSMRQLQARHKRQRRNAQDSETPFEMHHCRQSSASPMVPTPFASMNLHTYSDDCTARHGTAWHSIAHGVRQSTADSMEHLDCCRHETQATAGLTPLYSTPAVPKGGLVMPEAVTRPAILVPWPLWS